MLLKRVSSRLGLTALNARILDLPYTRAVAKDKMQWSENLYKFMSFLYQKEYKQHKKYIKQSNPHITQALLETGFSASSENILSLVSRANFQARYAKINWNDKKVNKYKPWMWYYEPEFDKHLLHLTVEIAKELSGYLNGLPVLQSAYFWRSLPCDGSDMGSQQWHLDNNDYRQIRCVIALNDIDDSNGAIDYIDKAESRKIYDEFDRSDKSNRRNKKRDNAELESSQPEVKTINASKGDVFYLDVGNNYHRGSRNMTRERHVFVLQFMTPFHIDSKLVNRTQSYGVNSNLIETETESLVFKYYGNNYVKSNKNNKKTENSKWRVKLKHNQN